MFRCITELKGLAIDIDSFKDDELSDWAEIEQQYKCLFITSKEDTAEELEYLYDGCVTYILEGFRKLFAPSSRTHRDVLETLELETTEIAYVSKNMHFLENAMGFLGGTIWVTDVISYSNASKAPDLICRSLSDMNRVLKSNVKGFLGEVAIFPDEIARGMIIPVEFEIDGEIIPLYMLGRYFGYSHYMSQLHPYSTAIYLNKRNGKAFGKFDPEFKRLYSLAVRRIQKNNHIDGICSVPPRPGRENRIKNILEEIAEENDIWNLSDDMICTEDYPTQKALSQPEREENVEGVFRFNGDLSGMNIIIIDDIVSTGSTMRECIRELKGSGAEQIFIVVLAVNQIQGSYWSSVDPQICCPRCDEKMHLLINSYNKNFFYSCYECRNSTLDFEQGWGNLCDQVNREFDD